MSGQTGAFKTLGETGERWAGCVFSVIWPVHTSVFVAVKTVPILDAFRLRGDPVTGLPDPRPACAEIGTVCSSGRALRRTDRGTSTVFIAEIPDCTPVNRLFDVLPEIWYS